MIVTVAVDGLPGTMPGGVVNVTVKVSSPSKAILSFTTVNSTQVVLLLAANIAVNLSTTKSSPPLKKKCNESVNKYKLCVESVAIHDL